MSLVLKLVAIVYKAFYFLGMPKFSYIITIYKMKSSLVLLF